MITTQKEFEAAQNGYTFTDNALAEFGKQFKKEFGGFDSIKNIEYFYDEGDGDIDIETTTRLCSCCYPDERDYYNFPIHYLWSDDWISLEKARREEKQLAKEKDKAEKEEKQRKEHEEKRYQGFLKLKEEYEGEN